MGEGTATVYKAYCKRHMKDTWHISGYYQGGHDGVDICLDCAADIAHYLIHNNPKTEFIVENSAVNALISGLGSSHETFRENGLKLYNDLILRTHYINSMS